MATTKTKTTEAKAKESTSPESTLPPEESNGDTQVKLKLSLWDSEKQRPFTIGELYPCTEKEALRLIKNGTAVKADA